MKRVIRFFDNLILRLHNCKNYFEFYSIETEGNKKISEVTYRCCICGKEIKKTVVRDEYL